MYVFKVSMKHVWGRWHDFTFVTAPNKKAAILKALEELEVPDVHNDRVNITVAMEGPAFKQKKKKR